MRRLGCVAIPSSNGWVVSRKMAIGVWVRFGGLCSYISDGEERSGRMVTRVKGWRVGFVVLDATQD